MSERARYLDSGTGHSSGGRICRHIQSRTVLDASPEDCAGAGFPLGTGRMRSIERKGIPSAGADSGALSFHPRQKIGDQAESFCDLRGAGGLNLRVRAAAPEGECEFLTASFTDTWSLPEGKLIGKSLNAAVRACGDAAPPEIAGFMPGAFPGEGYLRFPVAGDCTYPDARLQLEQFWRSRPAEAGNWSITGTAMRFELKAGKKAEKISPRHIRVFSGVSIMPPPLWTPVFQGRWN